jgi:glycosyltransferase involved in cell wall biosynthesis
MNGRTAIVAESDATAPVVSVVVPALNSAATIARCLEAFAAQETRHRFEVIVVHSGEDDTCTRAVAALPGTRVLQLPSRALAATARNHGAAIARGAILGFIDSDVYVAPGWVDAAVDAAASGTDMICGAIGNANPHSAVSRAEQIVMFSEFLPESPERPMWFALSGNLLMPRAAYDRYGPFVEIRAAEDLIFSRRAMQRGARVLFYPRLLVFHDNRQDVARYLRNQRLLGRYTAMARRVVPFADSASPRLFVLLLPVAPAAKLAKIVLRMWRWAPRPVTTLLRELPLVLLGVLAYGVGQVQGACAPAETAGRWYTVADGPGILEEPTGQGLRAP